MHLSCSPMYLLTHVLLKNKLKVDTWTFRQHIHGGHDTAAHGTTASWRRRYKPAARPCGGSQIALSTAIVLTVIILSVSIFLLLHYLHTSESEPITSKRLEESGPPTHSEVKPAYQSPVSTPLQSSPSTCCSHSRSTKYELPELLELLI